MAQATFTPTGPTYAAAFTTAAANLVITNVGTSQASLFKIDNSSGNLCFVAFGATANAVSSIAHPTPGSGNSQPVTAVRTGETIYINPNLGTAAGSVYVGTISISGTGNIYIQPGV